MAPDTLSSITAVVFVGIMLGVGIMAYGAIYDNIPDVTETITNETFSAGADWAHSTTGNNSQFIQLAEDNINNNSVSVINISTGVSYVRLGNFTMNDTMCANGVIMLMGADDRTAPEDGVINDTDYYISYTHTDIPSMAEDVAPTISNAFMLSSIVVLVTSAVAIMSVLFTKLQKR